MKRLLMLAAMVLVIVATVGCDPNETPEPVLQSFEMSVDAVTKTSVTYSVTPTLLDKEYIAVVLAAETVEGVEDEALMDNILDDIKEIAGDGGLTFTEYMEKNAVKGAVSKTQVKGLDVDTDYALVVFGVDPANGYAADTYPFTTKFSTNAVTVKDCTFEVTATVEMNTVDFAVVPSDADVAWHLVTLMKSDYDAYLDPSGDYKWDKATFYQAYVENEVAQYLGAGYTAEEAFAAMYVSGSATLHAKGLNTNTEYAWLIAGFDVEDGVAYLATEITDGTYVTENVAKSDMTFEISVTDVEQMKAAIKITPSTDEETFCWMVQEYDGVQTADEVVDGIVTANKMWFDMGFMLYKGVQDYTGGPGSAYKYSLSQPGTDYCVVAFGYSGGVTTDPAMVTFQTLPGGDPADCTFEATVTKTTPYAAEFDMVPSDATVYYTADVCLASEFNEEQLVADVEAGIQQMFQMQQMFDPSATIASVISTYYWNGANNMSANRLQPDTEYMLYVCALDATTGKVAAVQVIDPFVKTSPVGEVMPEIELVGYYSGDDEAGTLFGQPEATAGKSIAVVKYAAPAEAKSIYSSIVTGNALDETTYPDSELFTMVTSYYWTNMDMTQPYSFFVLNWKEENTVLAYSEDQAGNIGVIARKVICATAEEKGDIADLKALVDELNSKESKVCNAAPMVKSDSMKPVVTVKEKLSVTNQADMSFDAPESFAAPKPEIKPGHLVILSGDFARL